MVLIAREARAIVMGICDEKGNMKAEWVLYLTAIVAVVPNDYNIHTVQQLNHLLKYWKNTHLKDLWYCKWNNN